MSLHGGQVRLESSDSFVARLSCPIPLLAGLAKLPEELNGQLGDTNGSLDVSHERERERSDIDSQWQCYINDWCGDVEQDTNTSEEKPGVPLG